MDKPKITKEYIDKIFDEIFEKAKREPRRHFTMYTGCKTQGYIKISTKDLSLPICSDPTCPGCSQMHKAMREEVEKQIKNIKEDEQN
jgi:hypothetical protein